jgi:magnesium transporter
MSIQWKRQQVVLRRLLPRRRRRRLTRVQPGTIPGTLASPEGGPAAPPRVTVMHYTQDSLFESEAKTVAECLEWLDRPGVTWINVDGLGQPEALAQFGERLHFHPLALEDVFNVPQRPKIEAYGDHYLLILRMLRLAPEIDEEQVSVFFGGTYVITVQERADGDVFEGVRERLRKSRGRVRVAGSDYLTYALIDAVIDGYFPVLESLGERLDHLEDECVMEPEALALPKIQTLRRDLLTLRRAIWPMREAVVALGREESALITAETRLFLRDCYDHALEALEIVETDRETASSVMEIYLAMQNQRLNEVMKVLTVMATLFIPLTFIASIYGMNFEHMPELKWRYGYPATLGLMGAVAGGLIYYFKRRHWW